MYRHDNTEKAILTGRTSIPGLTVAQASSNLTGDRFWVSSRQCSSANESCTRREATKHEPINIAHRDISNPWKDHMQRFPETREPPFLAR
jgi:hypothetical protein